MEELPLVALLTGALHEFVAEAGTRRALPLTAYVGRPTLEQIAMPEARWYDGGMRADLVTRALDAIEHPEPIGWITRGGQLDPGPADHEWFASMAQAFGRHGKQPPAFYVLTRQGWRHLQSGHTETWTRVRRTVAQQRRG